MTTATLDASAAAVPARTYTIHRYPAHLIEHWALEDRRAITIRPVLPQDDVLVQAFVHAMSPESRYSRFLIGLRELPPALLARFTSVDYEKHMALIAETVVYGREIQVGDARYVVDEEGRAADFAIAVADDWQTAGIGSRLMRALENAARGAGVAMLTGDVLGSNRKALDFMRQRGFVAHPNRDEPRLLRVEKRLAQA